ELLGDLLSRDECLLERLLPPLRALGLLLELDQLLLQQGVLPRELLDFVGHLLQERVDLLRVESPEEPHGELLLADVRGGQAHRSPSCSRLTRAGWPSSRGPTI